MMPMQNPIATPTMTTLRRAAPILLLIALSTAAGLARQADEALAVRRFESGLAFARDGNFEEALEDFEAVVNLYPTSGVADNAVLEIARYYLEVTGDLDRAAASADTIVNNQALSQTDSAAEAYVILGRASLSRGRAMENIDEAISSFQRGLRLHPDAPAVPQLLFFIAEGDRFAGRIAEALAGYRQVVSDYPSNPWAVRARLGAGTMLAFLNDPVSAMEEFQRVRDEHPERPESAVALGRTSTLYRLFVRPRSSTYTISPPTSRGGRTSRKVIALASTGDGDVILATDRDVASLATAVSPVTSVREPRGLGVGPDGEVVVIERGSLQRRGAPPLQLTVPDDDEPRALREIDAVVVTSAGDWLVADRRANTIQRFSAAGDYLGEYAGIRAERLAIDSLDQVAVLDNDERIFVYDQGRRIAQIATRTETYRIDNPVDLAFDVFGHLYVLDRKGIYIFGRDRRLLTKFPESENAPGSFDRATALAVDAAGRVYVADERDKLVFTLE